MKKLKITLGAFQLEAHGMERIVALAITIALVIVAGMALAAGLGVT